MAHQSHIKVNNESQNSEKLQNEPLLLFKTNVPPSSPSCGFVNETQSIKASKLNDFTLYKSLDNKISKLSSKIEILSNKLRLIKSRELYKSLQVTPLETVRQSTDYSKYINSIKDYIGEDEETESSSDDGYSQIEGGNIALGSEGNTQRRLTKYQSWLVQRCQFHAKWSWLLSEIQSTEFRLKHLKKYSDEVKNAKKKFSCKNDINVDESARSRYMKLEKRKRVQTHNLLSPDLIKFVSPLYSGDDNSSDKFVHCRCRLGDTGPCILCCGMKNKTLESTLQFLGEEDMWKASLLDNSIHRKLSNISDVRNQIKRNVLFNGYVKTNDTHWSYPRVRTSLSPILTTPTQPKSVFNRQIKPLSLEFEGFSGVNREFKPDFETDLFQVNKNECTVEEDSCVEKFEIKLPDWRIVKVVDINFDGVGSHFSASSFSLPEVTPGRRVSQRKITAMSAVGEDTSDESYIKRHLEEESKEWKRNYPQNKIININLSIERVRCFHGYEYNKANIEYGFDLRSFPLQSDIEKQLSSLVNISPQRSKRLKKKLHQSS